KHCIMSQTYFLEKNLDHVLVGSWSDLINENNYRITMNTPYFNDNELKLLMYFTNPFAFSTKMVNTDLLKKIKFSSRYPFVEDFEFINNISKFGKIANIPENLSSYRIYPNQLKKDSLKEFKINTLNLFTNKLEKLKINCSTDELKIHSAIILGFGIQYFNNNQDKLNSWLDVFFSNPSIIDSYSNNSCCIVKEYVKESLCGIF